MIVCRYLFEKEVTTHDNDFDPETRSGAAGGGRTGAGGARAGSDAAQRKDQSKLFFRPSRT
jgi:hypothetical protein